MRIIPVLDVMDGQVVRGVGGRRHEYRPIVSSLVASARPRDVAMAFREKLGLTEIYVADLDAITGRPPAMSLYRELHELGFRLSVDSGIRTLQDFQRLKSAEIDRFCFGLETISGPEVLSNGLEELGPDRVLFSLDLKDGSPLGNVTGWQGSEPWSIASQAVEMGTKNILVLDLARVGGGDGIGTEDLCRRLVETFPDVEVIAGGGVRGQDDLDRLERLGIHAVLVASALHNGRIGRKTRAR